MRNVRGIPQITFADETTSTVSNDLPADNTLPICRRKKSGRRYTDPCRSNSCPKNLTKSNVDDWEVLSAVIKRHYPQQDESQVILLKLTQRHQLAGEPAGTFLEALQALATRMNMDENISKYGSTSVSYQASEPERHGL